jgi:signal transduction histidine kinase/DNA-binding response OmpR family regulator
MVTLRTGETTNQQAATESTGDKVNILVVDDLPEKLLVLETILRDLGQNIIMASSGEEALRRVLEYDFAVILLDVNMPGMDGFETARYIRHRKRSARTPIIFVTAFADEVHTIQGYSLGAVDYILSPIVPEVLRTKVKVFVELFQMTQQVRRQADERIALIQEQALRAAAEEATRRSTFLAEAGKVLSTSLDYHATLRELPRLAVPFLADLAAVTPIDEHGETGATELAWISHAAEVSTRSGVGWTCLSAPLAEAIGRVVTSGNAERWTDTRSWPILAPEGEKAAQAEAGSPRPVFQPYSMALQPLRARGRTLGILTLGLGPARHRYGPGELALCEDLASRAAIALDNARLYEEVQEIDRRKSEFLAMLAHELRNPLAPIRNAVQILRLTGFSEPGLLEAREMIDRQVMHMARLIDDLLDMSRLSRGKILLRTERLDLVKLVRATAEDYRSILETSGLELDVQVQDSPLYTEGDPTRLAQVVGNVLHNAHKFTDSGGRVTVSVAAEPEKSAVIRIRDTGIGMEPAMVAQVFETFSQADRSLDRSRGGLGLGLALVKGLVELHSGTVQASSEGLGKGTELTIRLPLTNPPETPQPPEQGPSSAGRSYRILVIEDNTDAADSMRMLLTLTGHEVEVAADGKRGLELAQQFGPQVVLCDIGLPGGMDGYDVARALRQDASLASAFLIASTGYGQEEDQRRCREAGFNVHLTKPVDFAELQRLLATLPGPT